MTKTTARELDLAAVSEEVLVDYLVRHPDFFERHAGVLTRLRIPHERGGQTISLVERQVQALRDKNQQLEAKIHEFVSIAQSNDALSTKIHRLSCRLVGAHGAAEVIEALEASLREDFGASHWVMVCLRSDVPELSRLMTRHLRLIDDRGAGELKPFETFFEANKPRCGQIRDTQREYLFGNDAAEIGSAALVPLGDGAEYGLLAIGSNETERFQSSMSTDFLTRIGELVSAAVGAL
jgi:uncharacterized protein YigA (DUF484 family)